MLRKILLGLTVIAFAGAGVAIAQQSGIKRTPLQKFDFPPGYTTVTAIAEVPAGGAAGRHTHPGMETGYVLEGELELDHRRQAAAEDQGRQILPDPGGCRSRRQGRRQAFQSARGLYRQGGRTAGQTGAMRLACHLMTQ